MSRSSAIWYTAVGAALLGASFAQGEAAPSGVPTPATASRASVSLAPSSASLPSRNPKEEAALAEARRLMRERQYTFALDAYKKALKLSDGKDAEALRDVFNLQLALHDFKDAVKSADALLALAKTADQRSVAETDRGRALYQQAGDKPKLDLLTASDNALKAAIADDPKNVNALFLEGTVLARIGQDAAAGSAFKQCVSCLSTQDPMYLRAQHFAENPSLSTSKMAPAIAVTALDGSHFNLDAMGGRVVLVDFWATWCGPCNEELPHLQKIAKEFAGQPLVIVSVSWDNDESKWRDFIAKHEMTWVQYRDIDHKLSNAFGVEFIPHYFTIDSDGVLTAEMLGSGSDVEGKLKKLLARTKPRAQPAPVASGN